jgi:hypothetical protein
MRNIYFGIVHPYLLYGISSWGNTDSGAMTQLVKMQFRVLKRMSFFNKFDNIESALKYWDIMSVKNMVQFSLCRENYFIDWGRENISHNYQTRVMSNQPLFMPKYLNRFQNKTISYMLPRIWNSLPNELKELNSQAEVNIKLKRYFKESLP